MSSIPVKIKGYDPNCPICMEPWYEPWIFPGCGHMICEKCYLKQRLITTNCHMCREKFKIRSERKCRKKSNKIMHKQILRLQYEEYDLSELNYVN